MRLAGKSGILNKQGDIAEDYTLDHTHHFKPCTNKVYLLSKTLYTIHTLIKVCMVYKVG